MTSPGCCVPPSISFFAFTVEEFEGYQLGPNPAGATTLRQWTLLEGRGYGLFAIVTFCTAQTITLPGPIEFTFNGAARRESGGIASTVTGSTLSSSSIPAFGFRWVAVSASDVALRFHALGAPLANVTLAYRLTEKVPP